MNRGVLSAIFFSQPLGAVGQLAIDSFPAGNLFNHFRKAGDVAKTYAKVCDSPFFQFHGKCNRPAKRDGVHSHNICDIVDFIDRVQIRAFYICPKQAHRLIFRSFHILVIDPDSSFTPDRTAYAPHILDQLRISQCLPTDIFGFLIKSLLEIPGRQGAGGIGLRD